MPGGPGATEPEEVRSLSPRNGIVRIHSMGLESKSRPKRPSKPPQLAVPSSVPSSVMGHGCILLLGKIKSKIARPRSTSSSSVPRPSKTTRGPGRPTEPKRFGTDQRRPVTGRSRERSVGDRDRPCGSCQAVRLLKAATYAAAVDPETGESMWSGGCGKPVSQRVSANA